MNLYFADYLKFKRHLSKIVTIYYVNFDQNLNDNRLYKLNRIIVYKVNKDNVYVTYDLKDMFVQFYHKYKRKFSRIQSIIDVKTAQEVLKSKNKIHIFIIEPDVVRDPLVRNNARYNNDRYISFARYVFRCDKAFMNLSDVYERGIISLSTYLNIYSTI